MRLKEEYRGALRTIYSVVLDNGESPAVEFLRELKQRDIEAHKMMVNRYKRHGDGGPSPNAKHERRIVGRRNLFEFKTPQGARLCYFNRPRGGIVLTNGFLKGANAEQAFDRAEALRDAVLEGDEHGTAGC